MSPPSSSPSQELSQTIRDPVEPPPRPPIPSDAKSFAPYSDWIGSGNTRENVTGDPPWNLTDGYGSTDGMGSVLLKGESTISCSERCVGLTLFPISADTGTRLPPTLTLDHVPIEQVDTVLDWATGWCGEALTYQPNNAQDRQRSFLRTVTRANLRDKKISDRLEEVQKSCSKLARQRLRDGYAIDQRPSRKLCFSEQERERARVSRVRAKVVKDAIEEDLVYKKDWEHAEEIWADAYSQNFGVSG